MERIFIDSDDRNVAVRKVFTKAADTFAYIDKECKTKATADELHDAFIKGLVIVGTDDTEYLPIHCKVASKVATVTYVTTDSSTATTAKLATVKSA